ncbi:hypothetical protein [Marisediminicola senii]|uniref:hypothetical protein n=1 Tax=Marisediminicola senii TaxID=2711233 RepID=UPI0013EDD02E|nr:hypothetical protein [Marisediminicola senii]
MTDDERELPHGWFTFEEHLWHRVWVGVTRFTVLLSLAQAAGFISVFRNFFDLSSLNSIAAVVALVAAVPVATMFVTNARWPLLEVNLDTSALRSNETVIPLAEINRAQVKARPSKKGLAYQLRLSAGAGRTGTVRAQVTLGDPRTGRLDAYSSRILAEALGRTTIELPVGPGDPNGRFARLNHPTNITRDEAVALVKYPPTRYKDLPIVT